ncbi:MAG: M24 family metallopeptidase, partial [Planctomycetota bacterium]|nr:M24 family metallopeptidase [Planctomycetota bacterium]
QMVLIDAGCEWDYYASDVTRTFPVSGKFSEPQKAIYQLVLNAMQASIDKVRVGKPFNEFHDTATRVLAQGLIDLGIVTGTLDQVLESRSYAKYTIHKTGHWLGIDVHDQGNYAGDDGPRNFEPGMITTVEPGLYFTEDDEEIDAQWRGIAVRIEDNILVTPDGNINLSEGIAKTIEDVEAACAGKLAEPASV